MSARNPLDSSAIRARVSQFVTKKEAFACVRVSKAWTDEFIHHIWHTVDFEAHKGFDKLDPAVVERYGSHIRVIENLRSLQNLESLLHPSVCNVSELLMNYKGESAPKFIALYPDFLRMNSGSLRSFRFDGEELHDHVFPIDALLAFGQDERRQSPSKLESLRVSEVILSRDSLVALLRHSPSLVSVDLEWSSFIRGPTINTFQHQNVTQLEASIEEVFQGTSATTVSAPGESLLAHFPNLVSWSTYNRESTLFAPAAHVKAEVEMCCPKLDSIDTWRTPEPVLMILLKDVFTHLRVIQFDHKAISTSVIASLLLHGSTLQSVIVEPVDLKYDANGVSLVANQFLQSTKYLQLLPRVCSQLEVLRLEYHEMDMDWVEEVEWACQGLRELAVRFRGLDTKHKITRAIDLWEAGRENIGMSAGGDLDEDSIEARVARHLLKFKNLEEVCLGTTSA